MPSASTVVHEIAHQWFGNAVTLAFWPDIWLNEGFATFSRWIYDERTAARPRGRSYDEVCAIPAEDEFWGQAPANFDDPAIMFHDPVYDRGAATLQALRNEVGERRFFRILRRWYAENKYGNVATDDFIELSERVSDQDLGAVRRVAVRGGPARRHQRARPRVSSGGTWRRALSGRSSRASPRCSRAA